MIQFTTMNGSFNSYYRYFDTISEVQEMHAVLIASLLSIKMCVYMIDSSNNKTWGSWEKRQKWETIV